MKVWELEKEYDGLLRFVIDGRERKRGNVRAAVEEIGTAVASRGERALVDFSRRWDGWKKAYPLRVTEEEIAAGLRSIPPGDLGALKGMIRNVTAYHRGQKPRGRRYTTEGLAVSEAFVPMERSMVYVPAGTAPYPSSLIMGAVPARLAGVKEIYVATPARNGVVNPYILAAAGLVGVTAVYRVGGAQAIYAFAYGAGIVPKVDIIVGPGNAYVEEAKRDVYGRVGIDMLAGPTELIILATEPFSPEALAWDLCSQAEHDAMATVGIFSSDRSLLAEVEKATVGLLPSMPRRPVIERAIEENSFFVFFRDLERAIEAINRIAPEHMELLSRPQAAEGVLYPGIVYVGPYTTVAMGDYYIGTNHVLPTGGAGRFAGGLSVDRFMRRKVTVRTDRKFVDRFADKAMRMATIEGLFAHAGAIRSRKELKR